MDSAAAFTFLPTVPALVLNQVEEKLVFKAGIALANLQYYFPKREDLLHALFLDTGERYKLSFAKCMAAAGDSPQEKLEAVIRFSMDDIVLTETRHFFIQLWALLGTIDGYTGRLLGELYAYNIDELGARIKAVHPQLSKKVINQRATLMAAMTEGLMVVIGEGNVKERRIQKILDAAFVQALSIADGK